MCHEEKPEADFAFRSIATGVRQDHCRVCHAAYRRQHYLDNRETYIKREVARMKGYREQNRALLVDYLRSHPCVDCGEQELVLLEFDHRDPATKRREVGRLSMTKRWEVIAREIAKCDVRCAACHRRRTAQQMNWGSRWTLAAERATPTLERLMFVGARVCTRCQTSKPASEFSIKNDHEKAGDTLPRVRGGRQSPPLRAKSWRLPAAYPQATSVDQSKARLPRAIPRDASLRGLRRD